MQRAERAVGVGDRRREVVVACRAGPTGGTIERATTEDLRRRRPGSRTGRRRGRPRRCSGRRLPARAPSGRAGCSRRSCGSRRRAASCGSASAARTCSAAGEKRRLKPVMQQRRRIARVGEERLDRGELVLVERERLLDEDVLAGASARSASGACRSCRVEISTSPTSSSREHLVEIGGRVGRAEALGDGPAPSSRYGSSPRAARRFVELAQVRKMACPARRRRRRRARRRSCRAAGVACARRCATARAPRARDSERRTSSGRSPSRETAS